MLDKEEMMTLKGRRAQSPPAYIVTGSQKFKLIRTSFFPPKTLRTSNNYVEKSLNFKNCFHWPIIKEKHRSDNQQLSLDYHLWYRAHICRFGQSILWDSFMSCLRTTQKKTWLSEIPFKPAWTGVSIPSAVQLWSGLTETGLPAS